ncbi:tetratricopeptide repeat protein [Halothiobacillus sp.]|uniref:LysM peptidoglycan-binding domain-containing protein n=1 Tax=Halothiobacillus sp. TaxID=1891311 RepID=UPI002622FA3E|nr:tetratricopeptide repeat protein [Halothiobacillus sp.]MDD4967545.1 tetratricopeptide repeat protein [Halothiobacillus sp.]
MEHEKPTSGNKAPLLSIGQIIQLIENGEHDRARAALQTFLAKDPKNLAARNLQKQLTIDPAKALGPAVSTYTIQPGDTLGGLAARFLGNPMDFVILGRYNDIKRGRDLQVGQTIKIPSKKKLKALPDEPQTLKTDEPTAEAPTVSPATTKGAESSTSTAEPAAPASESQTVKPEEAGSNAIVKPISPAEEARALAAQQAGLAAMQKNQLEEAAKEFSKALAIDPSLELAKTRAAQVQQKRVQQYHEAALIAYRKQHLDEAIALWDKALALDPNYEPALGYRARAQELKRRLGQLNEQ